MKTFLTNLTGGSHCSILLAANQQHSKWMSSAIYNIFFILTDFFNCHRLHFLLCPTNSVLIIVGFKIGSMDDSFACPNGHILLLLLIMVEYNNKLNLKVINSDLRISV